MRGWVLALVSLGCGVAEVEYDPAAESVDGWIGEAGNLSWDEVPDAGVQGPPASFDFSVEGGVLGSYMTFRVADGAAGGEVKVLRSTRGAAGGRCYDRIGGQCLDLAPPVKLQGTVELDSSGDGVLRMWIPRSGALAGTEACFQAVVPAGAGTQISPPVCRVVDFDSDGDTVNDTYDQCEGGDDLVDTDGDGVADDCDPITVTPNPVNLVLDPGDETSFILTFTNEASVALEVGIDASACGFLTPSQPTVEVPGGGVAQVSVEASADGLSPSQVNCLLAFTGADGITPVEVDLEVTEPGFDIVFPSEEVNTPTNIDSQLVVVVRDESGRPVPGLHVDYELLPPVGGGVVFVDSGTTVFGDVTDVNGVGSATLDTPADFEGSVVVEITVTEPDGTELGSTIIDQNWVRPEGQVYFWQIYGGGGDILKMPADFSSPPVAFFGSSTGRQCAGCHVAAPALMPGGVVGLFTMEGNGWPRYGKLVNGTTAVELDAVYTPQDGSSHNDFNPAADKVVYNANSDLYILDVVTGTEAPVPGASNPSVRELMSTFSSDGSHIAFIRTTYGAAANDYEVGGSGQTSIWVIPSGGGVATELIPAEPGKAIYYPEFSPDGRWLAYNKSSSNQSGDFGNPSSYSSTSAELWIVPVSPDGSHLTGPARRISANVGYSDSWPSWSPDGQFLAFARDLGAGNWDLYLAAVNAATGDATTAYTLPFAGGPGGQHIPSWGL